VVSAAHVFRDQEPGKNYWVLVRATPPHDEYQITGFRDENVLDMTVLRTDAEPNGLLCRSAASCAVDDKVVITGFPNWHSNADKPIKIGANVTQTKIISTIEHISIDKKILSGASGSPALDSYGKVVGVVVHNEDHKVSPNSLVSIKHLDIAIGAPMFDL